MTTPEPGTERRLNGHQVIVYPGYRYRDGSRAWLFVIDDTHGTPNAFDSEAEAWAGALDHLDSLEAGDCGCTGEES